MGKRIFAFLTSEAGHDQMCVFNMKQILQTLKTDNPPIFTLVTIQRKK